MSKLETIRNIIKSIPKKVLVGFGVVAAVTVPFAVNAWGPDRPIFTDQNAADYVTFNSIVSSEGYGDERDFVNIKEKTASVQSWSNELTVEAGKTYTVRMYVHNNAKPSLNLVAENVRATAAIDTAEAKTTNYITGYIDSDNAKPTQYHDDVKFVSDKDFNLAYIPGSVTYYNNWTSSQVFPGSPDKGYVPLSDSIFGGNGVRLGYDGYNTSTKQFDGKIPGCYEYSGYVFFDVIPQFAGTFDFNASKQVKSHGSNDPNAWVSDKNAWSETYKAQPGELVDFRVDYTNVSGEQQDNVTLRDQLPEGLVLVGTRWYNLKTGAWQNAVGDITTDGINIGSYINKNTQTRAELVVRMPEEDDLECGTNTFRNVGSVHVNNYRKDDDATVIVEKECDDPGEDPIYTCDVLNINKISRIEFNLSSEYTAENGATYKNTTYEVTDPDGNKTTYTAAGVQNYKNNKIGRYSVVATANFDVNGEAKSATSNACKGSFEVEIEPNEPIYTCDAIDIKKISRTAFDISSTHTARNGAVYENTTYEVTNPKGVKTTETKNGVYMFEGSEVGRYSVVATANFDVNGEAKSATSERCKGEFEIVTEAEDEKCDIPGKEHLPKDDPGCKEEDEKCDVPGKEHLPKDDPGCVEDPKKPLDPTQPTPTTPTTPPSRLPATGAEAFGIVGLGSIVTSAGYFITSRKRLGKF